MHNKAKQIELTFDGLGVDKRVGMSVGLGVGCGRKEVISDVCSCRTKT